MTITIYDRATAAEALRRDLDPPMRAALEKEIALLTSGPFDLTDHTDILLIELGDSEADIAREAGFSPLVAPIDGARWGEPGFEPGWDLLTLGGGVFRVVFTFGSTEATILLVPDVPDVPDVPGVPPELRACFRKYATA